jgi:hypothetical protein
MPMLIHMGYQRSLLSNHVSSCLVKVYSFIGFRTRVDFGSGKAKRQLSVFNLVQV